MGRSAEKEGTDLERLRDMYFAMLRIRMIEEGIAARYPDGEMRCPVHLSIGQEAPAVGVCTAMRPADKLYSSHRSHAHYLAKNGDLKRMFAEMYGRATGCVGGRGGSMHLLDVEKGMMASVPIVGSAIPLALGSALADKRAGRNTVTAVFIGDATLEEGAFHESANFASLHKLPLIIICENNLYSVYTPLHQRQPDRPLTDIGVAHALRTVQGDGNDVAECHALAREAIELARAGRGPTLLIYDTYRWREHCGPNYDNDIGYRTEEEFLEWQARCPLARARAELTRRGALDETEERRWKEAVETEIEEAFRYAAESPFPSPEDAGRYVYA